MMALLNVVPRLIATYISTTNSLAWPDHFFSMGVIVCSINAQPKIGSGLLPIHYLFYCHYSGSTNQIRVFKLIEFLVHNVTQ